MAVADDLIVRMFRVGQVPGEVVEGDVAVLREDVRHPPLGRVGDLAVAVAEELLEPGAHPLLVLPLDVPVPDAVQRAGLQELEDRRVVADQLVELALQIVVVLAHAHLPFDPCTCILPRFRPAGAAALAERRRDEPADPPGAGGRLGGERSRKATIAEPGACRGTGGSSTGRGMPDGIAPSRPAARGRRRRPQDYGVRRDDGPAENICRAVGRNTGRRRQAMISVRGCWLFCSRKVCLTSSSSAVGCR